MQAFFEISHLFRGQVIYLGQAPHLRQALTRRLATLTAAWPFLTPNFALT
jgi:hypothetical protein